MYLKYNCTDNDNDSILQGKCGGCSMHMVSDCLLCNLSHSHIHAIDVQFVWLCSLIVKNMF